MNKRILIVLFLLITLIEIGASQTYSFNTCGASGPRGPDTCSYSGDNSVSVIGEGIQVWEVPLTGEYQIEAYGAQAMWTSEKCGGDCVGKNGALGAKISAYFSLSAGEKLRILVGQRGNNPSTAQDTRSSGGGGGTFIAKEESNGDTMFDGQDVEPLLVAGGGGGHVAYYISDDTIGYPGDGSTSSSPTGGSNDGADSSGGAGWSGSGQKGSGTEPESFLDGGVGGLTGREDYGSDGGFGGGGFGNHGYSAAGGGGYEGGDMTGDSPYRGRGGKSYSSGSSTSSITGQNTGKGYVEIAYCGSANFNNPSIQSSSYSDVQASSSIPASFDTDVSVSVDSEAQDDCGNTFSGNSLSSCSVTVTGEEGNSYSPSASVSGDTCEFSVDNNDDSNWEPGESVTIDISVTDDEGGTDSLTDTYSFVNTAPSVVSTSPSSGETVFNEQGVLVEADVLDWESYHTGDDLTVNLRNGDSFNNFYSTSAGGDSTVSSRWSGGDNTNEFSAMYGFDRGEEASYEVFVEDVEGASTTSSDFFTVEDAPEISGASPSGGAEGSTLSASIENPVETDHNDVIFRTVSNGVVGEDRIFTQAGTASTSVGDELVPGNTYEWYVEVDDTASSTVYDGITYMFTVPEVLRGEVRDSFRIPTSAPEEPQGGNIWVEVNRLTWQGADQTWWLQFTGTVAENAAAAPGSIWIEENAVNWVGTTGEHRRYEGTEIGGTETAGVLWIDDYNGDDLLHYTDQDGNITVVDGN